jgi:hypothetical protein
MPLTRGQPVRDNVSGCHGRGDHVHGFGSWIENIGFDTVDLNYGYGCIRQIWNTGASDN